MIAHATRLPTLAETAIERGEPWIYSAGFNVQASLASTGRIDCELEDLERLAGAGAAVAILSHQGSHRDGSAYPLDHVAAYLAECLGRPVEYFPTCASAGARERAARLRPGQLVLFGNTRLYAGEERNDPRFARALSQLGKRVAIGGFSKAHRAHASNVGLLRHRRGVATRSLMTEIERLEPWADERLDRYSVAVVGGLKREKTLMGLSALADRYDLLIPGGAVLNVLLQVQGVPIGDSPLGECDEQVLAVARRVLAGPCRAEIHLPTRVIVRAGDGCIETVDVADGVPDGRAIVDFMLDPWACERLARLVGTKGRALLAGTPALYHEGFTHACRELLAALGTPGVQTLLLGGDTVAELPWTGPFSTGGGAALHYIATGTCPVVEALTQPIPEEQHAL